jgi:hypothetical protein
MAQVTESLRAHGARAANQGDVWDGIAAKMDRMDVASGTGAMSDIYEAREESVEAFVQALMPSPEHCGAVFALDGKVAGMELFDAPRTFARALPKLVRSYALDALETLAPRRRVPKPPAAAKAQALLEAVRGAPATLHPALGEGQDARFGGGAVSGAALVARERVVHLLAFVMNGTDAGDPSTGGSRIHRHLPRRHDPHIVY